MKRSLPLLLVLFSLSSYAGLHKWVDADGKVHYSDEAPPSGAQVESVQQPRALGAPGAPGASETAASQPPARKTIFEQEADLKKAQKAKAEAAQKAAKDEEQAQTKRRNCEQARSQLSTLQNAPRVMTYDASGEPSVMDDSARQKAMSDAQAAISANCN